MQSEKNEHSGLSLSSSSSSSVEDLDHSQGFSIVNGPHERDKIYHCNSLGSDMSKKEDNPFSFKHFLKKDSSSNCHHTGARPKVYYERMNCHHGNSSLNNVIGVETDGVYSRNPTELPDFVQDHLVIEQCYLNNQDAASGSPIITEIDNLPDFALNSVESRPMRHRVDKKPQNISELSFDLSSSPDKRNRELFNFMCNNSGSSESSNPANYRRLHRNHQDSPELLDPINFPLDLPFGGNSSDPNCSAKNIRSCVNNSPEDNININDAAIPKSLPDFLSDGPIRNRVVSQIDVNVVSNSPEHVDSKLNYELESLRRDYEVARRQINEKNRRLGILEAELSSRRAVDYEETANLEKAMEQVEDNLKRSTRRAVNAESAVSSLKLEVKALMAENSMLRMENRELRNSLGASCSSTPRFSDSDKRIHRLAGDIRDAASSADSLLRQLMLGVDNLKLLAATLDNIDRIEDKTKDFLPNLDEDNAAGPAL